MSFQGVAVGKLRSTARSAWLWQAFRYLNSSFCKVYLYSDSGLCNASQEIVSGIRPRVYKNPNFSSSTTFIPQCRISPDTLGRAQNAFLMRHIAAQYFLMCFQFFHCPVIMARCNADKIRAQCTSAGPFVNAFGKQLFIRKRFCQCKDLGMRFLKHMHGIFQ